MLAELHDVIDGQTDVEYEIVFWINLDSELNSMLLHKACTLKFGPIQSTDSNSYHISMS